MSAGELAEATGLSSAATTTLLDRLERKGFVQRERDTVDRRKVRVAMTPTGQELVGTLYGPLARDGSQGLAKFTDVELEKVLDFLGEATELVDRHRLRLKRPAAGPRQGAIGGPMKHPNLPSSFCCP